MQPNSDAHLDFTSERDMTAAIRFVVRAAHEPTFAELSCIPNFEGPFAFGLPSRNVVFWPNLSPAAVVALKNLIEDQEIDFLECRVEVYAHAGVPLPNLPIARGYGPFHERHWFPLKFRDRAIRTFGATNHA